MAELSEVKLEPEALLALRAIHAHGSLRGTQWQRLIDLGDNEKFKAAVQPLMKYNLVQASSMATSGDYREAYFAPRPSASSWIEHLLKQT